MVIAAPSLLVWLKLCLLTGMGAVLLNALARRAARDPLLTKLVLGAFGLRVGLALAMFSISFYGWPILRPQQYGQGFWLFSVDSTTYHLYGEAIAMAWADGFELPDPQLNITYFFVVGLLYGLFGAHPLYPALFNCFLVSLTAIVAYGIGRRLFHHRAGLMGAALTGFWPSSLLWSSQVLKDSLSWALCCSALWLLLALAPERVSARRAESVRAIWRSLLLGGVVSALTLLRPYMGSILSVVTVAVCVPAGSLAFLRWRVGRGTQCMALAFVVVTSSLVARTWDLFRWLSPAHPDMAHFRLAIQQAQRGQLSQANGHFYRAAELNPALTDAYRGRAMTSILLGNAEAARGRSREAMYFYDDAVKSYAVVLEREQDPRTRAMLQQMIGRLYFETALHWLVMRLPNDAGEAYNRALSFHPSLASELGDLRPWIEQKAAPPPVTAPHAPRGVDVPETRARAPVDPRHGSLQPVLPGSGLPDAGIRAPLAPIPSSARSAHHLRAPGPVAEVVLPRALMAVPDGPSSERFRDLDRLFELLPGTEGLGGIAGKPATAEKPGGGVTRLDDEAFLAASEMTPESLGSRRQGFVEGGGYSLMDVWAKISTPKDLITYLPRALLIGFLAPFPSQWLDTQGSTGIMRTLASADMVLIYLLLPFIGLGGWRLVRRPRLEGLVVLAFILLTATAMSLVVANLGSLYRLRLQFVLPLLVVAGGGLAGARRPLVALGARPKSVDLAGAPPLAEPVATSAVATGQGQGVDFLKGTS
jgi:tetratricopeptide (TPR) repeat protein